MANGRITYKVIYEMQSQVMEKISGCEKKIAVVKTKQEDMAENMKGLVDTVNSHTEKIGVIRGKLIVWGVIGGGGVSLVIGLILLFGRYILGG